MSFFFIRVSLKQLNQPNIYQKSAKLSACKCDKRESDYFRCMIYI